MRRPLFIAIVCGATAAMTMIRFITQLSFCAANVLHWLDDTHFAYLNYIQWIKRFAFWINRRAIHWGIVVIMVIVVIIHRKHTHCLNGMPLPAITVHLLALQRCGQAWEVFGDSQLQRLQLPRPINNVLWSEQTVVNLNSLSFKTSSIASQRLNRLVFFYTSNCIETVSRPRLRLELTRAALHELKWCFSQRKP